MSQVNGKIVAKSPNGKGIKIDGVWYNVRGGSELFNQLATIESGSVVDIEFSENKGFKNISKIAVVGTPAPKQEAKSKVVEEAAPAPQAVTSKKTYDYNSPEKQAQIQRGNALNAAAAIMAGVVPSVGADIDTISEMTKVLANSLLDWLRAE